MMLTESPMMYAGGGFPWGLLIIGGIVFLLWRNGMFGGPGRFGPGGRYGGYGPGSGPGAGYGPGQMPEGPGSGRGPGQGGDFGFRGPRDVFEEWHREAHETEGARPQAPQAPAAPPAPPASAAAPAPETPARENEGPVVNA